MNKEPAMSVNIYPVVKTEPLCDDYSVTVNGISAALNTARTSAIPFNRRWPGHQRDIGQSEAVQFLSLEADEPVTFTISIKQPFDAKKIKIRPRSLGLIPKITDDGKVEITLPKPAYFTVEPFGRNRALHIFVDPIQRYDVDPKDPDVIRFGPGEHDAGLIELHSNQTLLIDEGAVVYACIHATDAQNIRILGRGILDNSRNKEVIRFPANAENNNCAINNADRRHTIQLEYCENILIDGITIRDSLVYNIRPAACRGLDIRNVKIIGCWRYNSDGIDMHNCIDVHISDCFIRTFDDSICVKGFDCFHDGDVEKTVQNAMHHNGKSHDTFKNALIERCVIWNDWGKCLEIGAETRAEEISDIEFRNCDLIHLTGAALDCMNVDYADVHDIVFRDIRIEADEIIPKMMIQRTDSEQYNNPDPEYMPNTIAVSVVYHEEYSAGGQRRGKNRDMLFRNIRLYGDRSPKARFVGYDDAHKTENITVLNLYQNDILLPELAKENWNLGDYTDNILIVADPSNTED